MKFKILEYYHLPAGTKFKEVINTFLKDLQSNYDEIQNLLTQINKDPSFIYPRDCWEIAKKTKHWILILCLILEKTTGNPVFRVYFEKFEVNEKIATIDVFIFYLKIFSEQLNSEEINTSIIKSISSLYEPNIGKKYYLSLSQMLAIDTEQQPALNESEQQIEMTIN